MELYEVSGTYKTPIAFKYYVTSNILDASGRRKKTGIAQRLKLTTFRADEDYLDEWKEGTPVEFICFFEIIEIYTGSGELDEFWVRGLATIEKRIKGDEYVGEVLIHVVQNKVRFLVPDDR